MNDFRPPRERLQSVLARVTDLDEGDTRGRAEVAGFDAVVHEMQRSTITPLEEIAGLILELRWKELVDMGAMLDKVEGGDQAAKLWQWAHKTRVGG